jgi:hypothetical protein
MAEQLADVMDVRDARTVVDVGGNFVHTLLLRKSLADRCGVRSASRRRRRPGFG